MTSLSVFEFRDDASTTALMLEHQSEFAYRIGDKDRAAAFAQAAALYEIVHLLWRITGKLAPDVE